MSAVITTSEVADYDYLKQWLSSKQIRKIRSGNNPEGIVLTRQQVYNIMKNLSKNFEFRNYLVDCARRNEAKYNLYHT